MLSDDWELITWQEQKFKEAKLDWLSEEENIAWDAISDECKVDFNDVEGLSDEGDDKWNAAMEKLDKRITNILNPDYKKPEDAISDILDSGATEEKLREVREEIHAPAPTEDIKSAIKEKYEE